MPALRRLTHLPAGLGWDAEPAGSPRAASSFAELATHWTAPFEPIESPAGQLASHWMKPFEPPGMPAPIRPAPAAMQRPEIASTHRRITGPGGMDTLRDVTSRTGCEGSCGCGGSCGPAARSLPRGVYKTAMVPRLEENTAAPLPYSCPEGMRRHTEVIILTGAERECMRAAIQEAARGRQSRPDCCDFQGPAGEGQYREWHARERDAYLDRVLDDLVAQERRRAWPPLPYAERESCHRLIGLAREASEGHSDRALHIREAFRDFVSSATGYWCNGCIDVPCPDPAQQMHRPSVNLPLQWCFGSDLHPGWDERPLMIRGCVREGLSYHDINPPADASINCRIRRYTLPADTFSCLGVAAANVRHTVFYPPPRVDLARGGVGPLVDYDRAWSHTFLENAYTWCSVGDWTEVFNEIVESTRGPWEVDVYDGPVFLDRRSYDVVGRREISRHYLIRECRGPVAA